MSFRGRPPPGSAGGAYALPPDPIAALKLAPLAREPRRLRRLASRIIHAFGVRIHSVTVLLFFPFEHWLQLAKKLQYCPKPENAVE